MLPRSTGFCGLRLVCLTTFRRSKFHESRKFQLFRTERSQFTSVFGGKHAGPRPSAPQTGKKHSAMGFTGVPIAVASRGRFCGTQVPVGCDKRSAGTPSQGRSVPALHLSHPTKSNRDSRHLMLERVEHELMMINSSVERFRFRQNSKTPIFYAVMDSRFTQNSSLN